MDSEPGLDVPRTLEEACDPRCLALLVYDMQVGIAGQLPNGDEIVAKVKGVLQAAREGGFPIFFSRHVSLPKRLIGVFQLRQQMAWQRVERVEDVKSPFQPDAPQTRIVPELAPQEGEAVSDKIAMSAFSGTFLDMAMRDLGLNSFAICGLATEVGIEPTVRQGTDLGYVPVIVEDACGAGDEAAGRRSLDSPATPCSPMRRRSRTFSVGRAEAREATVAVGEWPEDGRRDGEEDAARRCPAEAFGQYHSPKVSGTGSTRAGPRVPSVFLTGGQRRLTATTPATP